MSGRRVRVTKHVGAIYGVVQSAAKRYRCNGLDGGYDPHWIEDGKPYIASALPPDDPDVGNTRWWHARYCMDCCPAEFVPEASR